MRSDMPLFFGGYKQNRPAYNTDVRSDAGGVVFRTSARMHFVGRALSGTHPIVT
jgi:hypothetical protein